MKFVVSRTSTNLLDEVNIHPCCNAKLERIPIQEIWDFQTPEEYDAKYARTDGAWYDQGVNHKILDDGCIARDNGTALVWTVDLNSLEELAAFCNKYGKVVISDNIFNPEYKEIEIYDTNRESEG